MPSKKVLAAAAAAATVVGCAFVLSRRSRAPPVDDAVEAFDTAPSTATLDREYSYSEKDQNASALHEPKKSLSERMRDESPTRQRPNSDGAVNYPNLGLTILLETNWSAQEEMTPMPNVAMVTIQHAKFAGMSMDQAMGQIPVLLCSVEDVSAQGLTLDEFKEKSKNMALTQMMMMTQGMFSPSVSFDGAMSVGPFKHCMEFELNTPYFQIKVLNLVAYENGLAFLLQYMCSPDVFGSYKNDVMTMARKMAIAPPAAPKPLELTRLVVSSKAHDLTVKVPSTWVVASVDDGEKVFAGLTSSLLKPETVVLTKQDGAKGEAAAMEVVGDSTVVRSADLGDGVHVVEYHKPGHSVHHRTLACDGFVMTVVPTESPKPVTADSELLAVLLSITKGASSSTTLRYQNDKLGFAFDSALSSRFLESRLSERAVTYAPEGMPREQEAPAVCQIRTGDPSNDPDCCPSLELWTERIKEEQKTSEGAAISDLRQETFGDNKCLTFVNTEMAQVGPGKSEERKAKVVITLKGIKTVMLRWECATENYRKQEPKIYRAAESLEVY